MTTNRSNITASVSKAPSKGKTKAKITQKSINTASRMEDDEMAGMKAMEKSGKAKYEPRTTNKYKKGGKVVAKKGKK